MKNAVIIHVGLQKTGTTFIQEEIFRKMKGVRYIRDISFTNLCFKRDKKTIIANERLSGDPYNGTVDRLKVIDNIHKLFPDAKIIVGIRYPPAMANSLYSQYIRNGGYDNNIWDNIVDYTNYKEYIGHIQSLFKDVFIYYYDIDLRYQENKADFIKRLCDFIDEPVPNYHDKRYRVSLKPYQLKTMRTMNKLLKHHLLMGKIIRELINAVSNSRMQPK